MTPGRQSSTIRVLLVDDDLVDRLACRRALATHPAHAFDLLEADTGREGIALARTGSPDVILLDFRLPDLDGIDFLTELHAADTDPEIPVVMLTSTDNITMAVDALRHGARDYLVKDPGRQHLELLPAVIERVLREQLLDTERRTAEARFRTLVEQIPAITYMAASDGSGRLLYISPQVEALGLDAHDMLADPDGILAAVHPEDRGALQFAYRHSCRTHEPLHCEYRLLNATGTNFWLRDEARLVTDVNRLPLFLQGIRIDISEEKRSKEELRQHLERMVEERTTQLARQTELLEATNTRLLAEIDEHRQTESALRTSEERFRLLLESAGEGIYGLDCNGHCTFVNDTALEMLGFRREELLGHPVHARIHHSRSDGSPYPAEQCPIYDAFRDGIARRGLVETLWRADGSTLIAEYSSHPLRVAGQVLGAVLVFRDVTAAHERTARLAWQASHDPLTGLVNRREFEARLANAIEGARASDSTHMLCYLDLDRFKMINDTCGHAAGDELLRQVSRLLHQRLRQRDTLARLGGDEFGVLLEHCQTEKALEIAEELCRTVRDFRFAWHEHEFAIGVSIGVAPIDAGTVDIGSVMNAADVACYAAKTAGRDRVHLAEGWLIGSASADRQT